MIYLPDLVLVALVFVSVLLVVISIPHTLSTGFIGRIRQNRTQKFERWQRELFIKNSSAQVLAAWHDWCVLAAFLVVAGLTRSIVGVCVAALLVMAIWFVPNAWHWSERGKRKKKLEENLPPALDQLASAVRAGMTLSQALAEVSTYAPVPVSEEFGQIADDQSLGQDLSSALLSAKSRIQSRVFDLVVTAFLVNIEQGGNLPDAIDKLTSSLKEIWRLEQKLHTASAEGRKGALVLCVMPLVICVMVGVMQPDLLTKLVTNTVGYMILVVAVIMYVGGVYWINRILNVSV